MKKIITQLCLVVLLSSLKLAATAQPGVLTTAAESMLFSRAAGQQSSHPKDLLEFIRSDYRNQITNPELFALGFGLNPYTISSYAHEQVRAEDVFNVANRRALLHRFHHAVEYHNAIMGGRTDYMKWMFEPGAVSLPKEPTLYYLAQIQPVDWAAMAAALEIEYATGEIRANHPGDSRQQQLAMFDRALRAMKINWESLTLAYSASEASGHQAPSSRAQIVRVASSYEDDQTKTLDRVIKDQMNLLEYQDEVELRDVIMMPLSPEASHIFAAALGINPNSIGTRNPDGSFSPMSLFGAALRQIINFNWNHIAIASHITGQIGLLNEFPQLSEYLRKYGDIQVETPTSDTSFATVRQLVSELLSNIALRDQEVQKMSADTTSEPASTTQTRSSVATGGSTGLGECCVCLDSESNTLFTPCGHLACCQKCAGKVKNCPKCRRTVKERVRVYKN